MRPASAHSPRSLISTSLRCGSVVPQAPRLLASAYAVPSTSVPSVVFTHAATPPSPMGFLSLLVRGCSCEPDSRRPALALGEQYRH